MKVSGETKWTYEVMRDLYVQRKSASRTYVNGVKAVRLVNLVRMDGRYRVNMANAKVYASGDNFVIRYYDTDIVTFRPDGFAEIRLQGYTTNTTFARITQLTGAYIHEAGGACIATNKTRVKVAEKREGKAQWWHRNSVPFVEGMQVHLGSREIHPDDVARMPSDRRELYSVPSKEASKAFKLVWAGLKERIVFEINMGNWAEQVVKGDRPSYVSPKNFVSNLDTLSGDEILGGLLCCMGKRSWWRPTEEMVNKALKIALPNFRRNLLYAYAKDKGQMTSKGGQILRNGWYVKEGE